jgi:Mycobacterial cell wall arabinan synthesis protein/Arabinosyltransferase concanavalin like domain
VVAALGAAVVAFTAAALVAWGPADASRADYRWPARQPEAISPSRSDSRQMLFAPLMLSRRTPARLSIDVPCAVVGATTLIASERLTLFASANNASSSGMWLVIEGARTRLGVGDAVLAETPWSSATLADPDCMVSAAFRGEKWRLRVGDRELRGDGDRAPVVNGLFTRLPRPVGDAPGLSVRVTAEAGSSPSLRQVALTVVSVVAATAALALLLLLAAAERRRRAWMSTDAVSAVLRGVRKLALIDAVVVVALGACWFFGPVIYDDGWYLSTVLNFRTSGSFSNYYVYDTQFPLGFLHELFHFATSRVSTSLLWMRFAVLVVGLAMWAMLRWYLDGLLGNPRTAGAGPRVALASAFLLSWFAWLSTLRPEPMVAALSVVVLVAILRFHQTAALRHLTLGVLAATVAITLHPAGLIAVAPLLVTIPTLWRWAQQRGSMAFITLVALGLVAAAVLVLLVMADTDLEKWRQSRDLFTTSEVNRQSWRDEFHRYQLLLEPGLYSAVVRRASVVFGLVALVLFATRPSRRRDAGLDLPVMSLVVGVVLMALTPSKWPFQFGALGGFAALAIATELRRLGLEPAGSKTRNGRSALVLVVTVVASVIAWRGGADFGPLTVLEVEFGQGGSQFLGVDLSSPVPWLVLAAGALMACTVGAAWRRRLTARAVMDRWLAVSGIWAVPVVVGVVLAATLGLFVTDAIARSPGWSLPSQNYDDLTGHTCGMADDIGVADPTMGAPLEPDPFPADTADSTLPDATLGSRLDFTADGTPQPPPGIDVGTRWGSRIAGGQDTGVFFSPWFVTGRGDRTKRIDRPGLALFTAGRPNSAGNLIYVQFGRRDGQAIHPLRIERVAVPDSDITWQPAALEPPPGTSRIRIIAVDASPSPSAWLAFSAPRRVRYTPLGTVLAQRNISTLIGPEFRLYFPCATNPPIIGGVTRPPDYDFVGPAGPEGLGPMSPMAGTFDLFALQQLLIRTSNGTDIRDFFAIERIVKGLGLGTLTPFDNESTAPLPHVFSGRSALHPALPESGEMSNEGLVIICAGETAVRHPRRSLTLEPGLCVPHPKRGLASAA